MKIFQTTSIKKNSHVRYGSTMSKNHLYNFKAKFSNHPIRVSLSSFLDLLQDTNNKKILVINNFNLHVDYYLCLYNFYKSVIVPCKKTNIRDLDENLCLRLSLSFWINAGFLFSSKKRAFEFFNLRYDKALALSFFNYLTNSNIEIEKGCVLGNESLGTILYEATFVSKLNLFLFTRKLFNPLYCDQLYPDLVSKYKPIPADIKNYKKLIYDKNYGYMFESEEADQNLKIYASTFEILKFINARISYFNSVENEMRLKLNFAIYNKYKLLHENALHNLKINFNKKTLIEYQNLCFEMQHMLHEYNVIFNVAPILLILKNNNVTWSHEIFGKWKILPLDYCFSVSLYNLYKYIDPLKQKPSDAKISHEFITNGL